MTKSMHSFRFTLIFVATYGIAIATAGCTPSQGPWERQAYEYPNVETPIHKVKVTPGSPLPFEQRLPAGNLNLSPTVNVGN